MATEEQMRASMQNYIDGFNSHDGNVLASLFADDARIEDPVGGPAIIEGRAAVDEFYRRAVEVVDRLVLAAPIRGSHASAAAMAFDIHLHSDGHPLLIRTIDVMTFDDAGKIIDMKAYYGPGDVEVSDPE
jgi:steroid delta-isomerase